MTADCGTHTPLRRTSSSPLLLTLQSSIAHSSRRPAFLRRRFSRRRGVSCPIRLRLVSPCAQQHAHEHPIIAHSSIAQARLSPPPLLAAVWRERELPDSSLVGLRRTAHNFNFTTQIYHRRVLPTQRARWPFNFTTVVCCQCNARTLAIHIPLASAPPRTHATDDVPARTPGAPSHTLARVRDACLAVARVASRVRAIWRQEVDCM